MNRQPPLSRMPCILPGSPSRHIKRWAKDAGLDKSLQFHMARDTFATMALEHGADLYTMSKRLGHSNITTTTIYAEVVDDMKKKAVMGLPRL